MPKRLDPNFPSLPNDNGSVRPTDLIDVFRKDSRDPLKTYPFKVPISEISGGGGVGTFTAKIVLTPTEIYGLNSGPLEILPAPGVGKLIQPIQTLVKIDIDTTPYNAFALNIKFPSANYSIYDTPACLAISEKEVNAIVPWGTLSNISGTTGGCSGPNQTHYIENEELVLSISAGTATTGDSTITLYITYTIIEL